MKSLTIIRSVAIALGVITFAFFFIHDNFRLDNIFFIPDMLLCIALVVAALLPKNFAVPALMATFGAAAGIFSVSVASYAVRGEFGLASFIGILISLGMIGMLARFVTVKAK